jgi:hypothetical protein
VTRPAEDLGRGAFDPINLPKADIPVMSYRWGPIGCQCSLEIALKKLIRNYQGLERTSEVAVAGGNGVIDGSLVRVDSRR